LKKERKKTTTKKSNKKRLACGTFSKLSPTPDARVPVKPATLVNLTTATGGTLAAVAVPKSRTP